jgi:RNA 3'-terminal phosphate cyclase (ATP)
MIRIGTGELAVEGSASALRGALALSCATGASFQWEGFRRKRKASPGFRAADSEAVELFAQLSGARREGGRLGEVAIEFEPARPASGEHRFELSPAGSMCPLLRAAAVSLVVATRDADIASELSLSGSTHAPGGETFEVTSSTFGFFLRKLGVEWSLELACAGFAPRGGGEVVLRISPAMAPMQGVELMALGPLESIQIVSGGASLPAHVQQRQAARARSGVHISGLEPTVQLVKLRSRSAGSVVATTGLFGEVPITVASVSQRGRSSEFVGEQAAANFRRVANQSAVVPEHLVDSLLPFLAFAAGESRFTTPRLPSNIRSHARLIHAFTDREVVIEGKTGQRGTIRVGA